MASHLAFVSLAAAYMLRPAFAEDPFTFCTEASCSDCPISVTSAGTVSMHNEKVPVVSL